VRSHWKNAMSNRDFMTLRGPYKSPGIALLPIDARQIGILRDGKPETIDLDKLRAENEARRDVERRREIAREFRSE
jgi:hypothetical protein